MQSWYAQVYRSMRFSCFWKALTGLIEGDRWGGSQQSSECKAGMRKYTEVCAFRVFGKRLLALSRGTDGAVVSSHQNAKLVCASIQKYALFVFLESAYWPYRGGPMGR